MDQNGGVRVPEYAMFFCEIHQFFWLTLAFYATSTARRRIGK